MRCRRVLVALAVAPIALAASLGPLAAEQHGGADFDWREDWALAEGFTLEVDPLRGGD